MELSPPNYLDWKAMAASFEVMAAYAPWSTSKVGQGEPMQVEGANLAADLLPILGIAPAMGRWFTVDDERSAAPGVVILGYGLWKSRFGGRMDAIGEKILLDGDPHTIIGVMPPEFSFPQRRAQVWRPLRFAPVDLANRNNGYLAVIARRKPEVSLEQARQEMRLAKVVQEALIPTQAPRINGIEALGWALPASITGGDCYDLWQTQDGRLGIFLGDATGHGIGPAMVVSQTRTLIRAMCDLQIHPDPAKLLAAANALALNMPTASRAAYALLPEEVRADPAIYPSPDILARSQYQQELSTESVQLRRRIISTLANFQ